MDEGVGLGVWILDFGFGICVGLSLCLHLFMGVMVLKICFVLS